MLAGSDCSRLREVGSVCTGGIRGIDYPRLRGCTVSTKALVDQVREIATHSYDRPLVLESVPTS